MELKVKLARLELLFKRNTYDSPNSFTSISTPANQSDDLRILNQSFSISILKLNRDYSMSCLIRAMIN